MTDIYDIPPEANLHNACIEPCDVIGFPCVCGSWHQPGYYTRRSGEERRIGDYPEPPWSVKGGGIIYDNRRKIPNPKGIGPKYIPTPERRAS